MDSEAIIKEYVPSDKKAVLELIRLNTPKYFAVEEENDLSRYLDEERELYYVLACKGKIVGSGGINLADNGRTGRISWDIIHPDYQGRSLGTRLLRFRIKELTGRLRVDKITVRTSQLAYRFYEKHGFKLKEVKPDYWAKGFDLYCMEYRP